MAWNNNPYPAYGNQMNGGMPMNNGYNPSYTPSAGYSSVNNNPYQTQAQMQSTAQNMGIQGRMVTSKEEALGVPVDFSGNPLFLADLAHNTIFVKKFNMNTGAADFAEFRLVPPPQPPVQQEDNNNVSFVPLQDFQDLNDVVADMKSTINSLQKEIDRLKKPVNSNSGKVTKKDEQ